MVGGVAWPSCEPKIDLLMLSHLTFTNHVHLFDFFLKKNVNIWFLLNKKSWKGRKTFCCVFKRNEESRHKRIESSNVFSPFWVCARGGVPVNRSTLVTWLNSGSPPPSICWPFLLDCPFSPFFSTRESGWNTKVDERTGVELHIGFFFCFCFIHFCGISGNAVRRGNAAFEECAKMWQHWNRLLNGQCRCCHILVKMWKHVDSGTAE